MDASTALRRADLNLLPALAVLLRHRHVTRAADALGIGQPAMSAALARLRRLFDDDLLVRRGRVLELTPLGQSLVEPLDHVLAGLDRLLTVTAEFDPATDRHSFTVAASDYVTLVLLRPLLEELYREAPAVSVSVVPVNAATIVALERGQIDMAVMPVELRQGDPSWVRSRPLFTDRYLPAVWAHNREIGDVLDREAIERLPYVGYRAEDGGRGAAYIDIQLHELGIQPRTALTTLSFALVPSLLPGTPLFAFVHERLLQLTPVSKQLRQLQSTIDFEPINETLYWHTATHSDPAHHWLRERISTLAANL